MFTVPVLYRFDDIRNCAKCRTDPDDHSCRHWEEARKALRMLKQQANSSSGKQTSSWTPQEAGRQCCTGSSTARSRSSAGERRHGRKPEKSPATRSRLRSVSSMPAVNQAVSTAGGREETQGTNDDPEGGSTGNGGCSIPPAEGTTCHLGPTCPWTTPNWTS